MAKTPPSRSYRLFSGVVCFACAYAVSAHDKAIGAALSASPATMLLLVIEAEMFDAIAHLLSDGDRLRSEYDLPPGCEVAEHWMAPGLDRFPATSAGRAGTRVEATPPASISRTPGPLRWAPFYHSFGHAGL